MDADRPVYRVQPERGRWKLSRNDEMLEIFEAKLDAVEEGRKRARAEHPSQLVIHGRHGVVEVESIY
ncbi:DUF2188 domain-containing protein [Actinopolymorpha pittospori]|uniref:DUF2188 domain-containing protein n=1 Tax=Actinopolymorpha pittospori TaxID=648752 RepID=A0A927R7S2_9ACTN|nr:DUF2188 domain-containing protein [Actinopolymorpha pittospori]MBE1605882.1 hypothetical protein [Actinopolymorpha pittospori]